MNHWLNRSGEVFITGEPGIGKTSGETFLHEPKTCGSPTGQRIMYGGVTALGRLCRDTADT